jgi:hypothetical protein
MAYFLNCKDLSKSWHWTIIKFSIFLHITFGSLKQWFNNFLWNVLPCFIADITKIYDIVPEKRLPSK